MAAPLLRAVAATLALAGAGALSPFNARFPAAPPSQPAAAALAAPAGTATAAAAAADWPAVPGGGKQALKAQTFSLSDVRLIPDAENFFAQAQDLNTQYLKYLDADRLLYTFRTINGLPQHGGNTIPYGGWSNPVGREELVNGRLDPAAHSPPPRARTLVRVYCSSAPSRLSALRAQLKV